MISLKGMADSLLMAARRHAAKLCFRPIICFYNVECHVYLKTSSLSKASCIQLQEITS